MNKYFTYFLLSLLISSTISLNAGNGPGDILLKLQRLKSPYRALYLAAHPDDENTRLISYLNGEEKCRTAYLSLTRGSGGQNLIGTEKGPGLGVLRTEELLSARKIDGGEQFFTRAVDFGYSKTSKETFGFWSEEEILSDVVYIIRYFKPHVVINRFPTENYGGHGHHHASALLSKKAFDLVSDPNSFPDQLNEVNLWTVGSLYLNSSTWWDKSLPERAKNDASIKVVDAGTYNPLLGMSYNELAAYSRSQHKSQGFGASPRKGSQSEYLTNIKGQLPQEGLFDKSMLDSVDIIWTGFEEGIDAIIWQFEADQPEKIVPGLLSLYQRTADLDSLYPRFRSKLQLIAEIIKDCMGLSVELTSEKAHYNAESSTKVALKLVNRSKVNVSLNSVEIDGIVSSWNRPLEENVNFIDTVSLDLSKQNLSQPYWLANDWQYRYTCEQKELLDPRPSTIRGKVKITIDSVDIEYECDIVYQWTDRVKGGLSRPIVIAPPFTIEFDKTSYFVSSGKVSGNLIVKSNSESSRDIELNIKCDSTLKVKLESTKLTLDENQIISIPFEVNTPKESRFNPQLTASASSDSLVIDFRTEVIDYDHVRPQEWLPSAEATIIPIEFDSTGKKFGYIDGPDNQVFDYLKLAGLNFERIEHEDIINGNLSDYSAILFGIRSLNVDPEWNKHAEAFHEYIKNGGVVILQYQTSRGLKPVEISPYSFTIGRDRITDENAETKMLQLDHPILNSPYNLSKSDFKNWNQERGLYFANEWDEKFTPLLSWHDPDELDAFGGLIVSEYGKGAFIYTGISFFRHIPYGIPGSYKLMYNLLNFEH